MPLSFSPPPPAPAWQVLEKIIELQTHEATLFEELGLPMAIKRLAWEKSPSLFVKVVTPHTDMYISSEYAPKMVTASQQVRHAEWRGDWAGSARSDVFQANRIGITSSGVASRTHEKRCPGHAGEPTRSTVAMKACRRR